GVGLRQGILATGIGASPWCRPGGPLDTDSSHRPVSAGTSEPGSKWSPSEALITGSARVTAGAPPPEGGPSCGWDAPVTCANVAGDVVGSWISPRISVAQLRRIYSPTIANR